MKFLRSLSIRWQLVLLMLALALPFLAYLLVTSARQAAADRDAVGREMLGVARLTAARLDDQLGDILQVLSILSVVVGTAPDDKADNDAMLTRLSTRLPPQTSNVTVWSVAGDNVGSLDPRYRAPPEAARQLAFFKAALASPQLSIQGPVTSSLSGRKVGIFAMRVERGGQFVGVVAVETELRELQRLLTPEGMVAAGGVITVTDTHGVVLARSIDPDRWIGRDISNLGGLTESRQRREGVSDARSADGVHRIAGFVTAKRAAWLVYVGVPVDVAMAATRARLYASLAFGASMLAVGIGLAGWVARRISEPLRQLGVDATALERGRLSHRSEVRRGDEIGVLAATLNRMAAALQQRDSALDKSRQRLRQLAEQDHLTGLPNRAVFLDRLGAALEHAQRDGRQVAVLFLDIDHFKSVNDTFGHEAGDAVLKSFARDVEGCIRQSDLVARLAGDEFVVVLEAVDGLAQASRIAQAIVEAVRHEVQRDGRTVKVSTSIGIALCEPGDDTTTLTGRADQALYEAKRAGRNGWRAAAGRLPAPALASTR